MLKLKKKNTDLIFLFTVFSFYILLTNYLSSIKPLSFDELFTHNLSKLKINEIINSLGPLDPHPPLNKFITSVSQAIFGPTKFATRLPAIIFFGITILVTYKICNELINKRAARVSSIILLATTAQFYSYEARPYALVFMLTSVLIYLFVKSTNNKNYNYTLITITTTALISTHFYALFIPLILLFGFSFDAFFLKKKVNRKLWLSVLIGCSTILLYLPTIHNISNSSLSENNWATPSLSNLLNSLRSIYFPFICFLIPALLKWKSLCSKLKELVKNNYAIFYALIFLSSFSIIGFLISLFLGAYNTRYFLVSILGCLIISTLIISQYNKKQFVLFGVLFLMLFGFQINNQLKSHIRNNEEFKELISLYNKTAHKTLIVSSSFNFMKIQHYAKENHKQNIKYLIDSDKNNDCKGCGAGDISIFYLSKLNKEFKVTDINKIKEMNDTLYYIYSGSPDSHDIKKLFKTRKFDTIKKVKNYYLLESKP